MNNPAKWISKRLGAKLLVASALAFALAWIGHHFVTEVASEWFFYDTRFDSYWEGKCDCAIQSFQEYVSGNNLSRREALTDSEWERVNPDIVLFTEPALLHEETQADYESGGVEQYEPITCSDGVIYVTSYAPGNIYFYQWEAAGIAIGFMLFLMIIIPFTVHIIHRINKLYHLVLLSGQSGRGGRIAIKGCDEISCLGTEIESMRLSLLALVENEAKIREDSEQLVASLSHDIRTPLTKLTGYLEILIHKKAQPGVDETVYLEKAAEKARQLKALTDELFEKFVLDGGRETDLSQESVDGAQLFNQLLYEECYELAEDGFMVDPLPVFMSGYSLCLHIEDIHRAFDNIFSNLRKYADPHIPIVVTVNETSESVGVTIQNHKKKTSEAPVSHKVGLMTVKRLVERNCGTLNIAQDGNTFSVDLALPKYYSNFT